MEKVKIILTEDQHTWLRQFFNREWDEEVYYQSNNEVVDTTYLEDLLDIYDALLGKTDCIFTAMAYQYDIEQKQKEIKELKKMNKKELKRG